MVMQRDGYVLPDSWVHEKADAAKGGSAENSKENYQ